MKSNETVRAFRRRRGVELASSTIPAAIVAEVLDVTVATIGRWRKLGPVGPKHFKTGRPRKLNDGQLAELAMLLSKGATAHGWPNAIWTTKRIAEVIRKHFSINCRPNQAWTVITKYLGWTSQKPVQQMRAADDDEINRWLTEDYPRIVDRAHRRRAHLVFIDESGFMLAPLLRRTYAPRGHPPVCKVGNPHGKVSVIGAMTISPRRRRFSFYFAILGNNANYRGATVVSFLDRIRRTLGGPLTILWDAIPTHRASSVRRYLNKHPKIVSDFLPRYAPDLNPVDKVWFYVKFDRLPNFAPPCISKLAAKVKAELKRLRRRPDVLRSLFGLTKLSVGRSVIVS